MKKVIIAGLAIILLVGLVGIGHLVKTRAKTGEGLPSPGKEISLLGQLQEYGKEEKAIQEQEKVGEEKIEEVTPLFLGKEISPLSQPHKCEEEAKALQEQEKKATLGQALKKIEEVAEQEKEEVVAPIEVEKEEAAPLEVTLPTKVTLPSKPQVAVTPLPVKTPLITPEAPAILSEDEERILDVQKKIALTRQKNVLGGLELESLNIALKQQKVKDEITGLPVAGAPEPELKPLKTEELPLAVPPSQRPQPADLTVLMYSSCREGARALIRDGRKTFYVRVGSEISRGQVIAVTPQGIGVQEETKVEFYPISSP